MGKDLEKKVLNGEDLELTHEEKNEAIKKEEHFRNIYNETYSFDTTKSFYDLCTMLITGNKIMIEKYKDKDKDSNDLKYIIKFAFRDFFILLFIGMKSIFDNDIFLKELHKKVYFSKTYVTMDDFEKLIEYASKYIDENGTK